VDAVGVSMSEVLAALDAVGVSVIITDLDGHIRVWSDSATALFGWTAHQVLGRLATQVTEWGLGQADAASVLLTSEGTPWSGETTVRTASGDLLQVRVSASLAGDGRDLVLSLATRTTSQIQALDDAGTAAALERADITHISDLAAQLLRLSAYDQLTALPNRTLFAQELARARDGHLSEGSPLALLFVDLDRFKLVNDERGHAAGDELLVEVASRLRTVVRQTDLVARFGDDEFVVICPATDGQGARNLAEVLCRRLGQVFAIGGVATTISVSIGVASTDVDPVDELLQCADRALHHAKNAGRARVEVHHSRMRAHQGRLQLLEDLRRSIYDNTLELHYQPIVGANNAIAGLEALLRWVHPERGPLPPTDVISLAEDNGLTSALGRWILARACHDLASLEGGERLHVAVNLSARQLNDPAVVSDVHRTLHRFGLAPERLVVEVTETSVITDVATTYEHLQALKDLGVRVALDDFGTGYSSLVYVRKLPVDMIKIDRSFVAGMVTSREDYAIVASMTNLAATVGLDVVAEGVESEEQAQLLRGLGCPYTQGYLWSRPVPLNALRPLLRPGAFGRPTAARQRATRSAARLTPVDQEDISRIVGLHRSGASVNTIAAALNADGRRTSRGTRWHASSVARVLADHAARTIRHEMLAQ
jgi:diguanylate cyclase (GGDEF)-like protein/PAS domain S-box-containing protein